MRIIVTGLIAQHPQMGGVAWDYVQFPRGLLLMGHDVYYVEDSGEWPYKTSISSPEESWELDRPDTNLRHLASVMERFGLGERWSYRFPKDDSWHGMSDTRRREAIATADLLLNVSGTLHRPEEYRAARVMAYVDTDPVFTQIKLAQDRESEFAKRAEVHDIFFSFGESLGSCIPDTGRAWLPTRHPMLLSEWTAPRAPSSASYTTVMNWTSYPPVMFNGREFGQKDMEFSKFLSLPDRAPGVQLEIALSATQHDTWQRPPDDKPRVSPAERLRRSGWRVVDPEAVCGDLDCYRDYISGSRGEWSVAKHGYVQGSPGWFSCRSACYLAAGRPVIVQNTGFDRTLPVGEGILPFQTLEEAAAALDAAESDYARHARAAREIAAEFFAAEAVLTKLLDRAGAPAASSCAP